jgi:hypothetical protein
MTEIDPAISAAASAFGRLGGMAGKGKSKRRPAEFYRKIGKLGAAARHGKKTTKKPTKKTTKTNGKNPRKK